MNGIFINGKPVGDIDRLSNTYITTRRPEHFMIKFSGFGISETILERLIGEKVKTIQIIYFGKETIKYECPIESYIRTNKTFNFNDDMQRFVSVRDMIVINK